jgi:hypothetical protein
MITKHQAGSPRRARRQTITLEIELPALSDEAAAAMASVLVQLYHRFEATYYAQILNHHADQAFAGARSNPSTDEPGTGDEPF